MPGASRPVLFLIILVLLSSSWCQGREERRDPETGKIRVIYLGDCVVQDNPSLAFIPEPWIDVTRIPATFTWMDAHEGFIGESVAKFMRRYMPRTYGDLLGKFDVIILSDAGVEMLRSQYLEWFREGVEGAGLGLTMIGGTESFGGFGGNPSWGPTSIGEILPVNCINGKTTWQVLFVRIERPGHPLFTSLPLKESPFPPFSGACITTTRQGADELARIKGTGGDSSWPFMVEWDRGKGRVFAFTSDWTFGWGDKFVQWSYYDDFSINLMLHLAGVQIPQDTELLHRVRSYMKEYSTRKTFLYAMIDFIEKFGARTSAVEEEIMQAEEARVEADRLYMETDLSGALSSIEDAMETLNKADSLAMKLKDSALFYVYVIEWLSVSGVSLLAGWVLFELMIRRKMYREMPSTRLGG